MERRRFLELAAALPMVRLGAAQAGARRPGRRRTEVAIRGDGFLINGQPAYRGRTYNGKKVEGLLMNIRTVQGIFDDQNPETVNRWAYPDTMKWDPERNTSEFVAAMAEWKRHGVLAFTVNLQGGTPNGQVPGRGRAAGDARGGQNPPTPPGRGRGPAGPLLENTAINPDGTLRPAYMARLERILDQADQLGMVAIVGYFYFGQDQRVQDEAAVKRAVVNATTWLLEREYRNVLVEVNNECGNGYDHEILRPARVPELIDLVKNTKRDGRRLLAATSWPGPTANGPRDHPDTPAMSNVVGVSDFVLIHGNGPNDLDLFKRMIHATRGLPTFKTMPVVINEDPNFNFEEPENHVLTALDEYVSWGYYDQGQNNYQDGFQSPPVNWGLSTDLKRQFFNTVKQITGV